MPGQSPTDRPESSGAKMPARPNSASMPIAATMAGSASGTANSRNSSPRPGKAGCRDSARATAMAGTTENTIDSAACHSVNRAMRSM